MNFPRGPLARFFIVLWCFVGAYVFTADAFLFQQFLSCDVLLAAKDQASIDAGIKTGTAEIRIPHLTPTPVYALRNPLIYGKQAARAVKCTQKPRHLSHIEYCGKKMCRAIMLQFHPRDLNSFLT